MSADSVIFDDPPPDYGMPVHPVCDMLPLIGGNDRLALEDDIQQHGLLHPVVIHDGQIVDGRNRILACRKVDIQPRYVEWRQIYKGPMPLTRWIWSVNVERRHLTLDQITGIETALKAWEEQQAARQRQADGHKRGGKTAGKGRPKADTSVANPPQTYPGSTATKPEAGSVRKKLAHLVGVSEHKIRQALKVQKANPALLKQVTQGTITLREAAKRVRAKTAKPREPKIKTWDFSAAFERLQVAVNKELSLAGEAKLGEIVYLLRQIITQIGGKNK